MQAAVTQGKQMPLLSILRFPDPRLKLPCEPVTEFDARLKRLAEDLLETMRAAPGVGMTAAHVGVPKRIVVIELDRQKEPQFYVNPKVLSASPEIAVHEEGSVSMPGAVEEISRPRSIRVAYYDLDGTHHESDADGFLATCLQHEIDQLDGIFWLQRLSRLKRERLIRKWEKSHR